jgi:hypothetical protein
LDKTWRCAFALVKRTATRAPLPSPKVYLLPAAVVTVSDPWRMNRRKSMDSNQSKIVSTLTGATPTGRTALLTRLAHAIVLGAADFRLPSLKQNPH